MKSNFLRHSFPFLEIYLCLVYFVQTANCLCDRRKCVEQLRMNMFQGYFFSCLTEVEFIYGFSLQPKVFHAERGKNTISFIHPLWLTKCEDSFFGVLISTDTCQHNENLVNWEIFFLQTNKCICLMAMRKNGKRMKLRVQCHTIERGDAMNVK